MNALIEQMAQRYRNILSHRNDQLFTHFLPHGYDLITLNTVPDDLKIKLINAKSHLGAFITLLDDFADNPSMINFKLLKELYKIPFAIDTLQKKYFNDYELQILDFAIEIASTFMFYISTLPLYTFYQPLFEFDVKQFFNCNRFYELAFYYPYLRNTYEIRMWGPFNMGIVIVGMIDIMANVDFDKREIGLAREFFYHAQRFGHICNTLTTLTREIKEDDYNNEALVIALQQNQISKHELDTQSPEQIVNKLTASFTQLNAERTQILSVLNSLAAKIHSFDSKLYIQGLLQVQVLHESLQGVI